MKKRETRVQDRDLERTAKTVSNQVPYQRRQATLYDTVAGRVTVNGFMPTEPLPTSDNRDTTSLSTAPVRPDEALFRRKNAPIRYAEDDIYFADRKLGSHQQLPDADLLKALHAYASDFYASSTQDRGKRIWKSMDETALLAMGILLEEAAAETLGETGDLVFVEGDDEQNSSNATAWNGARWVRSVLNRRKPRGRPTRTRKRAEGMPQEPTESSAEPMDTDVESDAE